MPDYEGVRYGSAPETFRLKLECPACGAVYDAGTHAVEPVMGFICWCGNDTFRAVKE